MNPCGRYILDDSGNPKPEPDLFKWGKWFEKRDRIVKQEQVGDVWVSTVFLGLDHDFTGKGPPILWETMTFRGDRSKKKTIEIMGRKLVTTDGNWEECERCAGNREQAEAMHKDMVERVEALQLLTV
jgi:hypothetical protein